MLEMTEQDVTQYWNAQKYDSPVISVRVIAYNQEPYISQCLDGVLAQKTEYPFEIVVHDDASTDKTADIIRMYEKKFPRIVKPIYETENQYSKKDDSLNRIINPHLNGKYVAICEGDDYWIDSQKLQIQCSFMESHPEFSMCMHNAFMIDECTGQKKTMDSFESEGEKTQREQIVAGLTSLSVATASYFLRKNLWNKQPELFKTVVGDYPIRMWYASQGKTYYFSKPMSVYRVNVNESYMTRLSGNFSRYENYIIELSKFYNRLDDFTCGQFHDVLRKKIDGDLLAFCSTVNKAYALTKLSELGVSETKLDRFYSLIDENKIHPSVAKYAKNDKELFIFGTSKLARVLYNQLKNNGMSFKAFVISPNTLEKLSFLEHPVYSLDYVISNYEDPVLFLAVQPLTTYVLKDKFEKLGIKHLCIPFELDELE